MLDYSMRDYLKELWITLLKASRTSKASGTVCADKIPTKVVSYEQMPCHCYVNELFFLASKRYYYCVRFYLPEPPYVYEKRRSGGPRCSLMCSDENVWQSFFFSVFSPCIVQHF